MSEVQIRQFLSGRESRLMKWMNPNEARNLHEIGRALVDMALGFRIRVLGVGFNLGAKERPDSRNQ